MRSLVTSIFLYAFESWTLTAELRKRIRPMEMRCYLKILRISYKDHVTSGENLCQDAADKRTTRRPHDHRKETPTEMVWTCLPLISLAKNHFARHSERGTKTRQAEFAKSQRAVENRGKKMEESGCEVIRGVPVTLAVKG